MSGISNNSDDRAEAAPLAMLDRLPLPRILKELLLIKWVRFLVVGGINTVFGYSMLAFFLFLNLHYSLACFLAVLIGMFFNFHTYGSLVFFNRRYSLLLRFIGCYGLIYLFYVVGMWLLTGMDVNRYLAAAVITMFAAVLTYFLNDRLVFRTVGSADKH